MARRYEYTPGRFAWNLEKCEEEVLIAAYDEVRRFIPPEQTWKAGFENHFFDHGDGVAVEFLDSINAVRRRRALVPRHRDFDGLILSHSRTGSSSGATRISMLRATPG